MRAQVAEQSERNLHARINPAPFEYSKQEDQKRL